MEINGSHYKNLPQKYSQLFSCKDKVEDTILKSGEDVLAVTWETGKTEIEQRIKTWIKLVSKYAEKEKFDVSNFLENMFESDDE